MYKLTDGILPVRMHTSFISRTSKCQKVTYYYVMCEVMITQGFPKGKTFR